MLNLSKRAPWRGCGCPHTQKLLGLIASELRDEGDFVETDAAAVQVPEFPESLNLWLGSTHSTHLGPKKAESVRFI